MPLENPIKKTYKIHIKEKQNKYCLRPSSLYVSLDFE
jgi:hypothetical protein